MIRVYDHSERQRGKPLIPVKVENHPEKDGEREVCGG